MSFISRDRRSLLAIRDLRIVVLARAISVLGDELALVALLLRTQAHGDSWAVVTLLLAGMLPMIVLAPLVGRVVDHADSRALLLVSSLGQLGCCAALAFASRPLLALPLVAALGAGQAVSSATWQALIPRIVGVDRLPAAMGLSQAVTTSAGVLAPLLGGLLTGSYGARLPLLLDAASFAAITVAAVRVRTRRAGAARAGAAPDRRGGWAIIRADAILLPLVLMLTTFLLLGGMVNVVEIFLVRDTLHASATWYGVLGTAWAVGLLLGAMCGGRLRGQPALTGAALAGAVGIGAGLAAMGAAPTVWWVLPAAVVGGASNGVLKLCIGALTAMRSADAVRGRVSATVNGLASGGQIGAMLLGGLLGAALSPRQVFLAGGLLSVAVPLVLCRRLLSADRLGRQNPAYA